MQHQSKILKKMGTRLLVLVEQRGTVLTFVPTNTLHTTTSATLNFLRQLFATMPTKLYTVSGTKIELDDAYALTKFIGQGAYGFVVSAKHIKSNERVAVKKCSKVFQDLVDGKRILREILLLSQLKHENIISIRDVLITDSLEKYQDVYCASHIFTDYFIATL